MASPRDDRSGIVLQRDPCDLAIDPEVKPARTADRATASAHGALPPTHHAYFEMPRSLPRMNATRWAISGDGGSSASIFTNAFEIVSPSRNRTL